MDLYKKYKENPMSISRSLVLSVRTADDYEKSRTTIINRYGSTNLVNMSGVKPTDYPMTVIAIPHIDSKVYVYFEYMKDISNPLIPIKK